MPKRTAVSVDNTSLGPKRLKAFSYDSNDNDEQLTRPSRKVAQKEVRYQEVDIDDFDDDDEPLVRNHKQPRPKPKKKGLSSTVKAASEPTAIKSKQQPSTTTSSTKAPSASLAKAPPVSAKASLIKATSAPPPPSILKTKANWNQENQENKGITNNSNSGSNKKSSDSGKATKKLASTPSMSTDQLSAALEDLKLKYKRLQQLRMTDAEKNLEDCRAKLDEATHSAENYRAQIEPHLESALRNQEKLRENNEILNAKVRTLQRQVREYEEKNRQREQEDRLKAKTASMESILASPDVTLPSAAKASTIQLYENLSGLKVLPRNIHAQSSKEKLPTTWDCEHSTPRGTLRFSLTYDNKNNKVSYIPDIDEKRDQKLLESLPDYLTDEIEFERQFEAKFFWRILNFGNDDTQRE